MIGAVDGDARAFVYVIDSKRPPQLAASPPYLHFMFGLYWMNSEPFLTAMNAACLDFSVAKEGFLTAYRWSGERKLSPTHLVHVPAAEV
jgi:hypothetical protein